MLKNMIFHPMNVYETINREQDYEVIVYVFFILSVLITFIKTFSRKRIRINFFETNMLNAFLSFLNIPQIKWILMYLSYFIFILIICFFCKLLFNKLNKKLLFISLMSISGLGVLTQIIFTVLNLILYGNKINLIFIYIIYIWGFVLSIMAIKYSQNFSIGKSALIFFISATPISIVIGFVGVLPYFAWL